MGIYATNQNRHMYVAKNGYSATVSEASNVGTIGGVKVIGLGNDKELVFNYKGADSTMTSDRIPLKNLSYVKAVKAAEMVVPLKVVEVTLNADYLVNSKPVSGQDYVLGIDFRQWIGGSDKFTYHKSGVVHATGTMTASDFYKKMVESLNLNFSRELGATKQSNPYLTFAVDNTTTATKIIITEKVQPWSLGTESQERVLFDVVPTTIYTGGEDVEWGVVTDATPAKYVAKGGGGADADDLVPNSALVAGTNAIGNGVKIADMEYFFMGERGDQYRNVGWPNVIQTTYLADATQQYNLVEFHFAFTGEGVNSYRSEKDITIAFPGGTDGTTYTAANQFIGAVNEAVGENILTTLA